METRVVAGRKAIEQDAAWLQQRKDIVVNLTARADAAVHARTHRDTGAGQRCGRRVAVESQREGIVDGIGFKRATFQQQAVFATQQQRVGTTIRIEIIRAENQHASGVEQPPVWIAAAHRLPVE